MKKVIIMILLVFLMLPVSSLAHEIVPESSSGLYQESGTIVRAIDNVRLRAEPSVRSAFLGYIGWGDEATLLEVSADGYWYKIRYEGMEAWVAADFFVMGSAGEGQTTWDMDNLTPLGEPIVGVRSRDNVRLRVAPSIRSDFLGYIGWGKKAALLGEDASGYWYQINYQGTIAWVVADAFELIPLNEVQVDEDAQLREPLGEPTGTVVAMANIRIRTGPSVMYDFIRYMPWMAQAEVLAMKSNGDWYQIRYDGTVGWATAEFLQLVDGIYPPVAEETIPVTVAYNTSVTPVGDPIGTVLSYDNVRLRAEPTARSAFLGYIGWGETADLLGTSENGSWYQIRYQDVVAWVIADPFVLIDE